MGYGTSNATKPTRVLDISNLVLTDDEVALLCKGMSFCPTPSANFNELNEDLFKFTRSLSLKYHFHGDSFEDPSIVKLPSTYCPRPHENRELKSIINRIEHLNVFYVKPIDNITKLRPSLKSLINKTNQLEIVIKSADKGDLIVVMSVDYYVGMCMRELSNIEYYTILGSDDPRCLMKLWGLQNSCL